MKRKLAKIFYKIIRRGITIATYESQMGLAYYIDIKIFGEMVGQIEISKSKIVEHLY